MKEKLSFLIMLFLVLGAPSCNNKKFDRVEVTKNERYSIAHKNGKCGVYDNDADSLVTALKYDELTYGRRASNGYTESILWGCKVNGCEGMLSIISETNEIVEIIFPKK